MAQSENAAKKYLRLAIRIGAEMLAAGAEIERVEDTIYRMCLAFGATKAQVFAMTTVIIVSIDGENYSGITELQRVHEVNRNLELLCALNNLSRDFCTHEIPINEWEEKLRAVEATPTMGTLPMMLWYAMVSAAFTIFFGGSYTDGAAGFVIGLLLAPFEAILCRLKMNRFLRIVVCCFVAGMLAHRFVQQGLGESTALINIGNIMIYIPGVIFTTAVQETFADNMVSATTRLIETVVISVLIATGFVVADIIFARGILP